MTLGRSPSIVQEYTQRQLRWQFSCDPVESKGLSHGHKSLFRRETRRGPTKDFFIGGTLCPDGKNVAGKGDPRREDTDVTM